LKFCSKSLFSARQDATETPPAAQLNTFQASNIEEIQQAANDTGNDQP
jgi:hypothetical protein